MQGLQSVACVAMITYHTMISQLIVVSMLFGLGALVYWKNCQIRCIRFAMRMNGAAMLPYYNLISSYPIQAKDFCICPHPNFSDTLVVVLLPGEAESSYIPCPTR